MKSIAYKLSALLMASILGLSFYFSIFFLIKMFPVIGIAIFSSIVLMGAFLFLEKDAVQLEEAI